MLRTIHAPGSYVQGPGALSQLGTLIKKMNKASAYFIIDSFMIEKDEVKLTESLTVQGMGFHLEKIGENCTWKEIRRHMLLAKDFEIVIGVGGGKVLDTAKAVAHQLEKSVVIIPTAISSDAPCSRISVIYKENHCLDQYLYLGRNPDLIIVDSDMIAKAPLRLLIAGIGDALSTYYEAMACLESDKFLSKGVCGTALVYQMAKMCHDILLENGQAAIASVRNGKTSDALEAVIEANTYLSGIGFESGGLAGAHAIHNGLNTLSLTHSCMHGELVAFGTLVQLALEQRSDGEILELIDFCVKIGLPVDLKDIGLDKIDEALLFQVSVASCQEESMNNMPFAVSEMDVLQAIKRIDHLAKQIKQM